MSIEKKFLPNLVLVIGINLLIKPFYIFGIDRVVQNTVGPEAYGLYFALFNLVYLFQIFNDLGIQNFNHSVYSKHDHLIPKYLPRLLGVRILLALGFLLVTAIAGWLLGYRQLAWNYLVVLTCNQVMASMVLFLRTNLSARGFYQLDSLLSVLDKSLMIIVIGSLLWIWTPQPFSIAVFIGAQSVCLVLTLIVAMSLVVYHRLVHIPEIRIDLRFTRWVLRKSLPYALVLLLMTLYTRMDAVMLERLSDHGQVQAGIYAASYRILDALSMIGLLFAGLLLPMFAKRLAQGKEVAQLVHTSASLLWSGSVTLVLVSSFFADPIMAWLYHGADAYWSEVFRMLMLSYIAISLAYVYGTLLTAHESIPIMNRIFVAGVVVNAVLNLIFILKWQAWGAALATVITQSGTTVALALTAIYVVRMQMPWQAWILNLLFLIFAFGWMLLIRDLSWSWHLQIAIFLAGALLLAWIFRQLPLQRQAWQL